MLPSPFTVIYYLVKLVHHLKNGPSQTPSSSAQNQEYCRKLKEIVESKIHFDFENSIKDDFADMKQDIQNFISEKQKEMLSEINRMREFAKWEMTSGVATGDE